MSHYTTSVFPNKKAAQRIAEQLFLYIENPTELKAMDMKERLLLL